MATLIITSQTRKQTSAILKAAEGGFSAQMEVDFRPSKSGKRHVIATTGRFVEVQDLEVAGAPIRANLTLDTKASENPIDDKRVDFQFPLDAENPVLSSTGKMVMLHSGSLNMSGDITLRANVGVYVKDLKGKEGEQLLAIATENRQAKDAAKAAKAMA